MPTDLDTQIAQGQRSPNLFIADHLGPLILLGYRFLDGPLFGFGHRVDPERECAFVAKISRISRMRFGVCRLEGYDRVRNADDSAFS